MSSEDSAKKPSAEQSGLQIDPQNASKYTPITGSDNEDAGSADVVRHPQPSSRRDYGAIGTSIPRPSTTGRSQTQTFRTERIRPSRRESVRDDQTPPMTPLSPQTTRAARPAIARRPSTARPHRGQEFSVDDDVDEYEQEHPPEHAKQPSFSAMRRQESSATVRRRGTAAVPTLPRVDSLDEDNAEEMMASSQTRVAEDGPIDEDTAAEEGDALDMEQTPTEEDLSDAESFTLRDKQLAINQTHPFGIRIWKPALYKKDRSVEKHAEEDIHSSPSASVSRILWFANGMWTIVFGWWLCIACLFASFVCFAFSFEESAAEYSKVFFGLGKYLFWPFGQFVKLETDDVYADEDRGEGRSIGEYERWQTGDLEHGRLFFGPSPSDFGSSIVGHRRSSVDSSDERDSLLGRSGRDEADTAASGTKRRLFGRGQWTLGRVVFFVFFYFFIAPLLLIVSGICYLLVLFIPMGRVTSILFDHLRRHPLALTFHPDISYARRTDAASSILLCTYRAAGIKYWKYTIDGTNIFLINLLAVVAFVIFDYFVLMVGLKLDIWLTSPALLFPLALLSIIPLAYFIGQAVASISAQSSMGVGAAVNAFFSTIVEVFLYCVALNEGKGKLVEGSVVGSIFAGILLLPGVSMCFGALKRKTQKFNVKSASATSTLLLFAVIASFGPTLFYKIYGSHELICRTCDDNNGEVERDCRQCYFRQVPAINDDFYISAVRPYCWIAAVLLFLSYIIGLLFTLRTHAAMIWATEIDEKKMAAPTTISTAEVSPMETRHVSVANGFAPSSSLPSTPYVPKGNIRDSQLYKRILGQSLKQVGLPSISSEGTFERQQGSKPSSIKQDDRDSIDTVDGQPHIVPPKASDNETTATPTMRITGFTEEQNNNFVRQVAEMAATAAAVAARDATSRTQPSHQRHQSFQASSHPGIDRKESRALLSRTTTHAEPPTTHGAAPGVVEQHAEVGGHDAPNWSRTKSAIVLLSATVAYAIIAEVLVDTVDVVLESVDIDQKFLGITLFALVPNTTEFLNAISFAMNGNIALSMEIGSAYALQVCLLQIPALVLFSAIHGRFIDPSDLIDHTFSLIFPQWDMITTILCVFLLCYMYGEGKSNYFKGSILVMTYLVVLTGFYFSEYTTMDIMGVDPSDTLALTISTMVPGRARGGKALKSEL